MGYKDISRRMKVLPPLSNAAATITSASSSSDIEAAAAAAAAPKKIVLTKLSRRTKLLAYGTIPAK